MEEKRRGLEKNEKKGRNDDGTHLMACINENEKLKISYA